VLKNSVKSLLLFVLVVAFCVGGCGGPVYVNLRKSPSAEIIANVNSEQSKKASYTFESKLPEAYSPFNTRLFVNLNDYYASNLKHYMNNKFSVVDDAEDIKIEVVLESSSSESRYDGEKKLARASYSDGTTGRAYIEKVTILTEITVKVKVSEGGRVNEKKIVSEGEYSGDLANSVEIAAESFNLVIEKSILQIDKFLDSMF
jgi:hypothetical protein